MSTIWFACRKCGKKQSRPETSGGTFVFCDCGEGNVVPWESTTEGPPVSEVPPLQARSIPEAPPLPPARPAAELPNLFPQLDEPSPLPGRPRSRRRPPPRRRDPRFCFNHEDIPSVKTCADCREAFCADCVLEFQKATVCGPCKNFRARMLQQPPRLSNKALSSVMLGLFTGPLALCLLPLSERAAWLTLLALLPQMLALVLGVWALRDTETNPRLSGRSLAITGTLTGALASFSTILLTFFLPASIM